MQLALRMCQRRGLEDRKGAVQILSISSPQRVEL